MLKIKSNQKSLLSFLFFPITSVFVTCCDKKAAWPQRLPSCLISMTGLIWSMMTTSDFDKTHIKPPLLYPLHRLPCSCTPWISAPPIRFSALGIYHYQCFLNKEKRLTLQKHFKITFLLSNIKIINHVAVYGISDHSGRIHDASFKADFAR